MSPARETPILSSASFGRQAHRSLGKTGLSYHRPPAQVDSSFPKKVQGRAAAAWPQSQAPVTGSNPSSMQPDLSNADSAHPFDQAPSLAESKAARKGHGPMIAAAARRHPESPAPRSNPFAMHADSRNTIATASITFSAREENRIAGGRMQGPGAAPISLSDLRSAAKYRSAKEQDNSFAPPGSGKAWPKPFDDSPPLTRHVSSTSLKQESSWQSVQHSFSHAPSMDDKSAPAPLLEPRKREQSCSSESRGAVIVLPPGPIAESRESEADAAYRLSPAAASHANTPLAVRERGRERSYPTQGSPESPCSLMMLPPGPVAESKESDADAAFRLSAAAASQAEAPRAAREQGREQSYPLLASPESACPSILLPPGPVAESKESDADAAFRLSAAAASQAEAPQAAREQGREQSYPLLASPESACPSILLPPGPVAESKESDANATFRLGRTAASQPEAPLAVREQSREQRHPLQASIGSRGPVIVLPPGPVAESKESAADAAYRLSAAAASQAEAYPSAPGDAAHIVVTDTSGIPENEISISMVSPNTSNEISRSGMAVSDKSRSSVLTTSEQKPRGSRESARGSVRWRSFRDSFREGGDQFRKRRWSLLLVSCKASTQLPIPCSSQSPNLDAYMPGRSFPYMQTAYRLRPVCTAPGELSPCEEPHVRGRFQGLPFLVHRALLVILTVAFCRWEGTRKIGASPCQCAGCRSG